MSQEKDTPFLQERISKYYASNKMEDLPSLERREFGFFQFGSTSMHRGIAFTSMERLGSFLAQRAPKHAYFSSAYYDDPTLPIAQRTWLGADLIFDLDADHIRNAKDLTYEEMLAKVKERFIYLIEGFILNDLGFDERDLHLVFSGGRGYHLHIRREDIIKLGARERREIVDYITGRGLRLFEKRLVSEDRWGKRLYDYNLPAPENGWRRRLRWCFATLIREISSKSDQEGIGYLTQYAPDVNRQTMNHVLGFLKGIKPSDLEKDEGVTITTLKDLTENQEEAIRKIVTSMISVEVAGETDEPVTSDIKRVIRIPGSVHGGSGLLAMRVGLDGLRGFDPLTSALLPTLTDGSAKVKWQKKMQIRLGKETYSGEPGKEEELPELAAFVLVCRGGVTIEG